jgi:ferric-dicitrate binding protein FerR (iron transport regulator)
MRQDYDIYELIARSFTGKLTPEEEAALSGWKKESQDNLMEYLDYEFIWRESGRFSGFKHNEFAGALSATGKKAGLYKKQRRIPLAQWAAVIVLSIGFSSLYHLYQKSEPMPEVHEELVYQEVSATYGTQTRMTLADGTIVYLNSGSSLKFPVSFSGLESRKVELSGEGFFEVNGQQGTPFIVDTKMMQVEVTGTRFNVDAYPSSPHVTIALVEGEVTLCRETSRGLNTLTTMKPGEVASLKSEENRLYVSAYDNLDKFYAWTEGKIVFVDDPIQIVVEKLSNWYNVDIEISDEQLKRYRFTGTFINEPVEQILAILSRTSPMGYRIVPSRKLDDNSFTRRKIILRSK